MYCMFENADQRNWVHTFHYKYPNQTPTISYRNLPIKGAPHNKGAPLSLEEAISAKNHQNDHSFFNICPIFNPKPALES